MRPNICGTPSVRMDRFCFYRSNLGTIRQLNSLKLSEESSSSRGSGTSPRRTIRSTITPAIQKLDKIVLSHAEQVVESGLADGIQEMLLSCQHTSSPCPVVALTGNWTQDMDTDTSDKKCRK